MQNLSENNKKLEFKKQALLASKHFDKNEKLILDILMDDKKELSIEKAKEVIKKEQNRSVK